MNICPVSVPFRGAIPSKAASVPHLVGAELPNAEDYDYSPLFTPIDKASELSAAYKDGIEKACYGKNGKLNPQIKKYLDQSKFVFELEKGKPRVMTIKEALGECIKGEGEINQTLYHATDVTENAREIMKNGFDEKRISRTEFGPGFYFAYCEGQARDYGGAVLLADCKGRCAEIKGKYYNKISNNAVNNGVRNFVGLKSFGYPTGVIEVQATGHIINEYVRDSLINDFGYDFTCAGGGVQSCVVAHNPNAIKNIRLLK